MEEGLILTKKDLEKKLGGLQGPRGSLRELIKKAEADGALLLLDCSGSMADVLSTGQRAIDALRQIVQDVRGNVEVAAAVFGPPVGYVDEIPDPQGSTPLHRAIEFGRAEKKAHLIVVSDGMPDSAPMAIEEAKKFKGRIDAIYVGNDGGPGAAFMAELAALTGGSGSVGDLTEQKLLGKTIIGLIGDGQPKRGIQL